MDEWTIERVEADPALAVAEIKTLQAAIEARDQVQIHSLHYENGLLDMRLGGEPAHAFVAMLVEFFKQNGGKNYFTLTVDTPLVEGEPSWHLEVTVRNRNGTKTPAEEIAALKARVAELEAK